MKIKLTPEQEDEVVRKSLKWTILNFIAERKRVVETGRGFVFSTDPKEDILRLTEHIDAMMLAHNYYSTSEQMIVETDQPPYITNAT